MRTHPALASRLTRVLIVAAFMTAAAGCSGGGGSSGTLPPPNSYGLCDPGTQVTLANPQSGQTGVSPAVNTIQIVANGNSNTLYQSYANFDIVLIDPFGNRTSTGPLSLVPRNGAPQPYPSDFYYAGTLPTSLGFGTTYSAYLNIFSSQCQQLPFLGSFST